MEPGSSRPGQGRRKGASAGLRSGSAEGLDISVILAAPGWRSAIKQPEALARRAAGAALREAGAAGAVTVLLANDMTVKRLNGTHRAKAKPTNCLLYTSPSPRDS